MARVSYSVSAPGKLMLLGEHAVLDGSLSLVCAVNRRIRVTLTPENHHQVAIQSGKEVYYVSALDHLLPDNNFEFVLAAVKRYQPRITSGFSLKIEAEFTDQVGLGSSAAVTAATVTVLRAWLGDSMTPERLHAESLEVVQAVQGLASGADLAACIYGGIVAYRMNPRSVTRLSVTYPITVVNSGLKTPTADVIRKVQEAKAEFPEHYRQLFAVINRSCETAVEAITEGNWKRAGQILNFNQGLMEALGVSNATLSAIVHTLRAEPEILGAKISGSGLGDCIVALGTVTNPNFPYSLLPLAIESRGVTIE